MERILKFFYFWVYSLSKSFCYRKCTWIFLNKRSSSKFDLLFYLKFLADILHVCVHAFTHEHCDHSGAAACPTESYQLPLLPVTDMEEIYFIAYTVPPRNRPSMSPPFFHRVCMIVRGVSRPLSCLLAIREETVGWAVTETVQVMIELVCGCMFCAVCGVASHFVLIWKC